MSAGKVRDESDSGGSVLRLHYNPHIIHACVAMQRKSLRLGKLGSVLSYRPDFSHRTHVHQMSNLVSMIYKVKSTLCVMAFFIFIRKVSDQSSFHVIAAVLHLELDINCGRKMKQKSFFH